MEPQASGVNRCRDKIVSEAVHRQQRSHLGYIAVVIYKRCFGQGWAREWLGSDDLNVGTVNLFVHEREGNSGEITSAAAAANYHIGVFYANFGQLLLGLQSDDGLVQHNVVQYRSQRVAGFSAWVAHCFFNSFGDGDS